MANRDTIVKVFDNEYYSGEFLFHHIVSYPNISGFALSGNNIKNPRKSISCLSSFYVSIKLKHGENKKFIFADVAINLDIANNKVEYVSIGVDKSFDNQLEALVKDDVKSAINEIKLDELLEKSFIESKNQILEDTLAEMVVISESINVVYLMK